jgi:hypothetical protein
MVKTIPRLTCFLSNKCQISIFFINSIVSGTLDNKSLMGEQFNLKRWIQDACGIDSKKEQSNRNPSATPVLVYFN